MNCIRIDWEDGEKQIPLPGNFQVRHLSPEYPPPLSEAELETQIRDDLQNLHHEIEPARNIALLVEDGSRITETAFVIEQLMKGISAIRGGLDGVDLIVAAGAHGAIPRDDLIRKTGEPGVVPIVHNSTDSAEMEKAGVSQSGISLRFNRRVAAAGLRFSVSTVNIHPMAGFSGGGKILLPGVAALETIEAFHGLPSGSPGEFYTPMRELINEVLTLLPIRFSWHLIADPRGEIVKIFGGIPQKVHQQGISVLKDMVTLSYPVKPAELVFAGCRPFNQNLLGTFKSFAQLNRLLKRDGILILFNEAAGGRGEHNWRNQPDVVKAQKDHVAKLFPDNPVAVFSPASDPADFADLFPPRFRLIRSDLELLTFLDSFLRRVPDSQTALVMPFAPITLLTPYNHLLTDGPADYSMF